MTSFPARVPGLAGHALRPLAAALAVALVAGCSSAGSPESTSGCASQTAIPASSAGCDVEPAGSPTPVPATAVPSDAPSASVGHEATPTVAAADPSALPDEPPPASLIGADGAMAPGALGSYTWNDEGSDAPWIVVPGRRAVTGGGPYAVTFDPAVAVTSWIARWAPIEGRGPGDVAGSAEGSGDPSFDGPAGSGPWTLAVEVRFVNGGSAAYFWRLRPAP